MDSTKTNQVGLTFQQTFTMACPACEDVMTFSHDYEALRWGVGHLRRDHSETYARLERAGRLAARSQNGCGYHDDDHQAKTASGWAKAQSTFRQAWIEKALQYHLRSPESNKLPTVTA